MMKLDELQNDKPASDVEGATSGAEDSNASTAKSSPPKPSPTATPERVAAAKRANTAKKVAAKPEAKADEEPKVKKPAAAKEAKASTTTLPFGELATVEEYVAQYNEMVLTAVDLGIKKVTTVSTFVDLKTGRLACERLHAAINNAREGDTDMATKAKKTTTKKTSARKGAVKGKTTAKKPGGGTRSKFEGTAKITWVGKDNPFREGSGRFDRVENLRKSSGKTVETFLKNGGRSGTLNHCVKAKLVKVG